MLELTKTPVPEAFSPLELGSKSESDLDALPFGVIALDAPGVVRRYNLYESRFARIDREQVLGRAFFTEIAPCTRVDSFEGRFQRFVASAEPGRIERFDFVFDFKFGAQEVSVEIVRPLGGDLFYLLVNRKRLMPPRPGVPQKMLPPVQRELAPREAEVGVRRDALERRRVDVSVPFFAALRATCERLSPEAWPLFAHEWGVQWGRRTAVDLESTSLEEAGKSLADLSMRDMVSSLTAHLAEQGWGHAVDDFALIRDGIVMTEVERSALAEAVGARVDVSGPRRFTCHLLAGLFAGVLSHVASRRLVTREIACVSAGSPTCRFVTVAAERRKALDRALSEGRLGLDEVRESLRRARTSSEAITNDGV
jgi:photoactive yellow protein